jgi:hypothetical protein
MRLAYRMIVTPPEQAEAELNRLGEEGWRLAQVGVGAGDGGGAETLYLFLEKIEGEEEREQPTATPSLGFGRSVNPPPRR